MIEWEYCDVPRCGLKSTDMATTPLAFAQISAWKERFDDSCRAYPVLMTKIIALFC